MHTALMVNCALNIKNKNMGAEETKNVYIGPMTEEQANSYNVTRLHIHDQVKLQKVVGVKDDSGHWYVIPMELHEEFNELLNISIGESQEAEQAETEFNDKFGQYRTNGDLNNVQLYAQI